MTGCAQRQLCWRLQGFGVLSCDLDITLFRNPLDPQVKVDLVTP